MKSSCPCCGKSAGRLLCSIRSVPVMVNQLCYSREEALAVPRGDITLVSCPVCGLVWNRDYQPEKLTYDGQYDNSQDLGQEYRAHFRQMLDFLASNMELQGKKVLEIGCGKGRFLTTLAKETGCLACGVDPSYTGPSQSEDGACTFLPRPYDHTLAQLLGEGAFDCVILRQVLDQLPDPGEIICSIVWNLRTGGYLYVEGLDFQRLLKERSVLDLSYERYTYFTAYSLKYLMSSAGIKPVSQTSGFKGQYLAVLGRKGADVPAPWLTDGDLERGRANLAGLGSHGKIALWGAANRGVMFGILADGGGGILTACLTFFPRSRAVFSLAAGSPSQRQRRSKRAASHG